MVDEFSICSLWIQKKFMFQSKSSKLNISIYLPVLTIRSWSWEGDDVDDDGEHDDIFFTYSYQASTYSSYVQALSDANARLLMLQLK